VSAEISGEMPLSRTSVLLVEDDPGIREALADLLELLGARVEVAVDGEDGWELLHDAGRWPSVVLLDLFLPRLDGVALLGRIRADARLRSLAVVTMSAAVKERPPGADAHLEKPFDLDRLVSVVRAFCPPQGAAPGRTERLAAGQAAPN
jgi:DNA-binding response OmpR family regulator